MTVNDAIAIFESFDYSAISKTNVSKQRNLIANAIYLLETLAPMDGVVTARPTPNGLLNVGDLGEACLKYAMGGKFECSAPNTVDYRFGNTTIEIKCALGPASKSSPMLTPSDEVVLLNGQGVWRFDYNTALKLSDERNRFKFTQTFDECFRDVELEELLGFEDLPSKATR